MVNIGKMVMAVPLFFAACTAGTVTDSDGPLAPPSDTTTTNPGGTVQRATLTVRLYMDPEDSSIATAAGVTTAGLTVRLTRSASSDVPRTAETGADGTVRFEGLLQGIYQVDVDRALTPAELARLPLEDRDASIFAGGGSVQVTPPARETSITLVATRRGSLVLSEVFIYAVPVEGGGGNNGHYMEVYNNADTTIYLDGILLFRNGTHAAFPEFPCSIDADKRADPTGIWAFLIHRFPGNGRDYPIHPGEAKVVAVDALDHGPLGGGMVDLSRAEFELIGSEADPNNPYAADMIRMTAYYGATHGEPLTSTSLMGLALPIARDTTQLAHGTETNTSFGQPLSVFKIPREAVLDAVGLRSTPETEMATGAYRSGWRVCDPFASPVFERAPAQLVNYNAPWAISRKSLGRTALGAEILQRTRTAARDFELATPLRRAAWRR